MLDCTPVRDDLSAQLRSIRGLLDATHQTQPTVPDISRETRGLCIVLLYASYERLLRSLCRAILEVAKNLGVGNRRLQPGLRVFAAFSTLQTVNSVTPAHIWRGHGMEVVKALGERRASTISPEVFPNDGSHMKQGQLRTFCDILALDPPGPVLREIWQRIDTIVSERNAIAHGTLTADEVGRTYSIGDLRSLVDIWERRWMEFLDHAETKAATRDFFRLPR